MKQESLKHPVSCSNKEDMKTTKQMLSLVSTQCGVEENRIPKATLKHGWEKLHISVVDGDIPITAIYSGQMFMIAQ